MDGKKTRQDGEVWSFRLKRGIRFQDDPCFRATAGKGREVVAADILFAIRRMADPKVNCPVVSWLQDKVLGFHAYMKESKARNEQNQGMDWTREVEGLQPDPKDPYSFRIVLNQPFPQLRFLMAMHFTTPIAREAVEYYGKDGYGRHPVGCGPFVMKEWLEKQRIVLERNPNFFGQTYPGRGRAGGPGGRPAGGRGQAAPAGRQGGLHHPAREHHRLELLPPGLPGCLGPEGGQLLAGDQPQPRPVPRDEGAWHPALDGEQPEPGLPARSTWTTRWSAAYSEQKKKLRQAISLSIDANELIALRLGGFGLPAQFVIPKDLFGYDPDYRNPYRQTNLACGEATRWPKRATRRGSARRPARVLTLYYDNAATTLRTRQFVGLCGARSSGSGSASSRVPRSETTYRDNLDQGKFQLIVGGWYADYPDPENFLFLLYGPYRRPEGSNTADYDNPEFNRLFVRCGRWTTPPNGAP